MRLRWDIIIFVTIIIVLTVIFTLLFQNIFIVSGPVEVYNSTRAFNDGIIVSMVQLIQATDKCQVASINYFNITRRLVDLDCVRLLLQQQNITLRGGE